MHQQTLELSEMAPKKKIPTFKTFVQPGKNIWERFVGPFFGQVGYQLKKFFHTDELTGKQSYNKIIRHGVAATALHGMNMSILGLYVNQLFVDHVGGSFDMYANAGSSNVFAAVWESLSHSWLGQSLLFFTVPIIIGRFVGTYMMKHDMKIGNITIPRLNNGSLLIASTVMTIAGVAAIAFGTWPVKLVGVVAAALGLTNVSPIVGGFTADRTRHVSDAVSTLLSATSLIAFGGNLLFGWLKDLTDATIAPWLPLLMPVACLAYLGYFGWEIATRRFDKEVSQKKTENKKTTAQNKTKSKKLLGIGALLAGGLGLSYLLGGLPGLGGGAVLAGGLPFLAKPQINEKKEKITKRNLSEKLAAEQISAQDPVVLSAKEKLAEQFDNWFDENEHFVANDETKAALRMVRDTIASLSSVEDAARVDLLMKKITEMPLGEKQPGEVTKIIFKAESLSDISEDDFFVQREIRGIPSQWLSFKVPSSISLVPGKDGFSLKEIKMGKTATDLQLRNVLTDIASKSGFEIRMGAHELGITSSGARKYREGELHIHFESPLPNVNAEYYNYILSINMGKLVHGKKAGDLQALYTKYFGRFLTEDIILWPSEKRSSYTNVWAQSIALLAIGWGLSQLVNTGTGLENAGLLLGAVPVLIHPSNIKRSNKPTVNWQDVSQAKMLNNSHLVWQLTDYQRNILGYAKFGTKRERERTKQFGQLMDLYGWQQKYNLFDISYPVVMEEGFEKLPSYLQRKIQHDREGVSLFGHVRSAWERSEVSFILSPVNVKGPNLRQWKDHPELIKEALRNIPITRQEWDQLISFFNELHGAGFEHTDLPNNLYISRNAQGKLQIALLDFEFLQHGTDDLSLEKWQQRLLKINMLEEKSENLVQGLFDFTFD
jgi:hypothetical protein